MIIQILVACVVMLTAALLIAKYQSQMFDISSKHFRFVELLHKHRLATTTLLFFGSVAFAYAFVNVFQGVING